MPDKTPLDLASRLSCQSDQMRIEGLTTRTLPGIKHQLDQVSQDQRDDQTGEFYRIMDFAVV